MTRRTSLGLPFALLLASCTGTETGNPTVIDEAGLSLTASTGQVTVAGDEGTISPPGAAVHVVNLDGTEPLAITVSDASGRFTVEVAADPTHVIRVQAVRGGDRSAPVDRSAAPSPWDPIEDGLELTAGETEVFTSLHGGAIERVFELTPDASWDGVLLRARLRFGGQGFTLVGPPDETSDVVLNEGRTVPLRVRYQPAPSGEAEDVLLLLPGESRLAITLVGRPGG